MSDKVGELFLKNINIAIKGRIYWLNLVNQYDITDQDYVILFPSRDEEVQRYGLMYLERFLKHKNADRAFIVSIDKIIQKMTCRYSEIIEKVITIPWDDAEDLMRYYSFYPFTDRLIIVSLSELFGRNVSTIINRKGISVENLIVRSIYGLDD